MNTSGYETVLQLRGSFLQRIVDEERQRPNSPFLQTFDEIPPTTIGGIEITETVVNVARGSIALDTLPAENAIRIVFQAAEAQLTFASPTAPSAPMYDLIADVGITGTLASATEDERVQIGVATDNVAVEVDITNGHPFANDSFLVEAITSQLQAAFASGLFPTSDMREGQDFVLFTADLFVEVENDVGGNPNRQIRASLAGPNQIAVVFPVHLRWTNIQSQLPLEPSLAILSEIVLTAPLTRQLENAPAFIQIDFNASTVTLQNTQAIEGAANLARPEVQLVVDQTLQVLGQEIANAAGLQRFDTLTLEEINGVVANLIQTSLAANGQLVPFWERAQDGDFQNATPRVLEGAIAIAINAGPDADPTGIELFLPEDRDFAVFINAELFLNEVDTFLHTPNPYRDLIGDARVAGGDQEGTSLSADGFADDTQIIRAGMRFTINEVGGVYAVAENAIVESNAATLNLTSELDASPDNNARISFRSAFVAGAGQNASTLAIGGLVMPTGTIRERTQLSIQGVEGVYVVAADAAIEDNQATLTLTSALAESPEDGARVGFSFGFGLPNRRFDAGGNDREVQIDGLNPSLQTGFFQLAGPITVLRPNALIYKEINGSVTTKLRLKWVDEISRTGRINGAGQAGNLLAVDGFDPETNTIQAETRFTINGVAGTYRLTQAAAIEENAATLNIAPALISSPGNNAEIRFLTGNQVVEQELIGDPDVDLAEGPAGILAAIVGALLSVFTGSLFAALIAVAVIFIVKAIIEVISGNKAGDLLGDSLSTTPLPDALENIGVDIESRFNNPIEISPDGILFTGTAEPTSRFASLDDTQARAGGPYEATAGTPLQLNGGLIASGTDYEWLTGDSLTLLSGRTPTYTYPSQAYRVAVLTTLNNQFEGNTIVQNRHLALVRVRNTVPVLAAIAPIQALEGEEIEVVAHFSDLSWLDTHTAYVLFGDRTAPTIATVVENNQPPAATGTLTARHTYCDNGQFTIAVKVIDDKGGSQTAKTTATIQNVPPVVEAGADLFAYACTPTRLVGRFEDQGWCDTHTATWNFGDCTPLLPASIEQTNNPPKSVGTATGTHCYQSCGVFVAELIVTDDDGGVGSDTLFVRVVDLCNGDFERGFHQNAVGQVANDWHSYTESGSTAVETRNIFACEQCVVYDGQRSQAIIRREQQVAGIYQQIGANIGWEYQFSAAVHLAAGGGGQVRLGIDPAGGNNSKAATVAWSETGLTDNWVLLAGRASATASAVSVFLEVRDLLSPVAYLDRVELKVYPCPETAECLPDPEPECPPEIEEQCVDWGKIDPLPPLDIQTTVDGIAFESLDGRSLRAVEYGPPPSQVKLAIPNPEGLRASWTESAIAVEATTSGLSVPIEMVAFDADGNVVAMDTKEGNVGELRVLTVQADAINAVEIRGGLRGTFSRICISRRI